MGELYMRRGYMMNGSRSGCRVAKVQSHEGGGEASDSCFRTCSIRSSTVTLVLSILTCVNSSATQAAVVNEPNGEQIEEDITNLGSTSARRLRSASAPSRADAPTSTPEHSSC